MRERVNFFGVGLNTKKINKYCKRAGRHAPFLTNKLVKQVTLGCSSYWHLVHHLLPVESDAKALRIKVLVSTELPE